jgi:hypothetical protein
MENDDDEVGEEEAKQIIDIVRKETETIVDIGFASKAPVLFFSVALRLSIAVLMKLAPTEKDAKEQIMLMVKSGLKDYRSVIKELEERGIK